VLLDNLCVIEEMNCFQVDGTHLNRWCASLLGIIRLNFSLVLQLSEISFLGVWPAAAVSDLNSSTNVVSKPFDILSVHSKHMFFRPQEP
jgi:hypothetical protein